MPFLQLNQQRQSTEGLFPIVQLELTYITVTVIVCFLSYRCVADGSGKWMETFCGKCLIFFAMLWLCYMIIFFVFYFVLILTSCHIFTIFCAVINCMCLWLPEVAWCVLPMSTLQPRYHTLCYYATSGIPSFQQSITEASCHLGTCAKAQCTQPTMILLSLLCDLRARCEQCYPQTDCRQHFIDIIWYSNVNSQWWQSGNGSEERGLLWKSIVCPTAHYDGWIKQIKDKRG